MIDVYIQKFRETLQKEIVSRLYLFIGFGNILRSQVLMKLMDKHVFRLFQGFKKKKQSPNKLNKKIRC